MKRQVAPNRRKPILNPQAILLLPLHESHFSERLKVKVGRAFCYLQLLSNLCRGESPVHKAAQNIAPAAQTHRGKGVQRYRDLWLLRHAAKCLRQAKRSMVQTTEE